MMRTRSSGAAPSTRELPSDEALSDAAQHPGWWQRLQLLWRLHLGLPAALGLVVLVVSLPLVADRLQQYRRLQQAWAAARPVSESGRIAPPADAGGAAAPDRSMAGAAPRGANAVAGVASAPAPSGASNPAGQATPGVTLPSQIATAQASAPTATPALPPARPAAPTTVAPSATSLPMARLIEGLPPGTQRGADLGLLLAAVRTAGLSVQQADYALESSRIPGLARLKVDLQLQGTPAQLQQLLRLMQDRFTNLAIDVVELPPSGGRAPANGAAQPPATVLLHTVQFYRAVDG